VDDVIDENDGSSAPLPSFAQARVCRDAIYPRRIVGRFLELVESLKYPETHLLHDIVGVSVFVEHKGEVLDFLLARGEEFPDGFDVLWGATGKALSDANQYDFIVMVRCG
jgi:hypothetical protein